MTGAPALSSTDCPGVFTGAALFASPDEWTARRLRGCLTEVHLPRGRALHRQGEAHDALYVVAHGRIKVSTQSRNGRSVILSVLGAGDMLGELSVFDDEPRCTATAVAVINSRLFAVSTQDLATMLRQRPDLGVSLLGRLSRRLRHSYELHTDFAFQDIAGRMARVLLDLTTRFGVLRTDGIYVHHGLTQLELAQLIGSSRETVNKTLSEFASRGWLRIEAGAVLVRDVQRLRNRARRYAGASTAAAAPCSVHR